LPSSITWTGIKAIGLSSVVSIAGCGGVVQEIRMKKSQMIDEVFMVWSVEFILQR
jgi:hypothetical protein